MSAEVDPRLTSAAAQRGLIPTKEQLEVTQSAVPGIAGMLLPFEFIYTLSFILALNVNMALISFIVLFGTLLAGYVYPAQKRVQAKDKPGIPVRERNQLGSHLWEEQNRYIAVIPAAKPIGEMAIGDIYSIFSERDLTIEKGGTTIIEGLPIDPEAIKMAREMLEKATAEESDSKTIASMRNSIKRLLETILKIAREIITMMSQNKMAFIFGSIIAFALYLFSPLWLQWWQQLLVNIGW